MPITLPILAALLVTQLAASAPPVPQTSRPLLLDGRCDDAEWSGASRTPLSNISELLLQQSAEHVYLCVTLPADSYGTMDLYVSSGLTTLPVNLHASAQVGERTRSYTGWGELSFGNHRGWYSPPVALSRAEVVDGKPHLTFGVVPAREVVIEKSKFGPGTWRFMIELRALGAAKTGTLRYPSAADIDDVTSWARIELR